MKRQQYSTALIAPEEVRQALENSDYLVLLPVWYMAIKISIRVTKLTTKTYL